MQQIMPREITAHEAAIIAWLLDYAAIGDVTAYRTKRISEAQVVEPCGCGCCSSLVFRKGHPGPKVMVADALAIYPDGKKAGLILWGYDDEIALLELYEMDPVADRVPEIADLCRWEDLSRRT